ncbi:MAG: hypothetical protein ACOYYU_12120 [Chloroflexota bacterium]
MAKVQDNLVVRGTSGSMGELVFRQMPDGSTWVSRKPDFSRRVFSAGQKEHQGRFRAAAAYARQAARTHPIYAELAAGTIRSAYSFALADWFHAPVIHKIERRGGVIRIEASDNVLVSEVRVMVLDGEGKVLEQGQAARVSGERWEYVPGAEGSVIVEARDLAGNAARGELRD